MSQDKTAAGFAPALAVRGRLAEALQLELVGPWPGHAYAEERLPGRERPSNRYLTGFLAPAAAPPETRGDADEDEELGEVPATAGLAEESSDERRPARKSYFPSSMGLSFLSAAEARRLPRLRPRGRDLVRDAQRLPRPGPGRPGPGRTGRGVLRGGRVRARR